MQYIVLFELKIFTRSGKEVLKDLSLQWQHAIIVILDANTYFVIDDYWIHRQQRKPSMSGTLRNESVEFRHYHLEIGIYSTHVQIWAMNVNP